MATDTIIEKYTTSRGELTGFISLFTPSTLYNKEGKYQAKILLSKAEGQKIVSIIEALRTAQYKKEGKGTKLAEITQCVPYTIINPETGEETKDKEGRYILKTSRNAYIKNGKPESVVQVFDSKLRPIKNARVGAGTIARLVVKFKGYTVGGKTGVSAELQMVQIIELVEYDSLNPETCGLQEEEGYELSEAGDEADGAENEEEELDF